MKRIDRNLRKKGKKENCKKSYNYKEKNKDKDSLSDYKIKTIRKIQLAASTNHWKRKS